MYSVELVPVERAGWSGWLGRSETTTDVGDVVITWPHLLLPLLTTGTSSTLYI